MAPPLSLQDASGLISLIQLEAAMESLGFPGMDSKKVRRALIRAGCAKSAGEAYAQDKYPLSRRDSDDYRRAVPHAALYPPPQPNPIRIRLDNFRLAAGR